MQARARTTEGHASLCSATEAAGSFVLGSARPSATFSSVRSRNNKRYHSTSPPNACARYKAFVCQIEAGAVSPVLKAVDEQGEADATRLALRGTGRKCGSTMAGRDPSRLTGRVIPPTTAMTVKGRASRAGGVSPQPAGKVMRVTQYARLPGITKHSF